jgi:hypothetical protein
MGAGGPRPRSQPLPMMSDRPSKPPSSPGAAVWVHRSRSTMAIACSSTFGDVNPLFVATALVTAP